MFDHGIRLAGGPWHGAPVLVLREHMPVIVMPDDRALSDWVAADPAHRAGVVAMTRLCVYRPHLPGIYAYAGKQKPGGLAPHVAAQGSWPPGMKQHPTIGG